MSDDCKKLQEKIKELEESEENLYNFFMQWFEEERGMYYDTFCMWWDGIKSGKTKIKRWDDDEMD